MKLTYSALAAALAGALAAPLAQASPLSKPQEEPVAQVPVQVKTTTESVASETRTTTDGGITVETMDGKASFTLDGRLQFDTLWYNGIYNDISGDGASDTRVRRMRLAVSGDLDPDWSWVWSMDISEEKKEASLDAFYIVYGGFSFADVTVGKFKRPFFLEAQTSSKWITFNERSVIYDVTRSHVADFGIMASQAYDVGSAGKLSWYVETLNEGVEDYAGAEHPTGRDQWQYWARVAWAPWAQTGDVLHFGLGLGELNPVAGSTIGIGSKLGVSAASSVGKTYIIDEDRQVGLESAWIWGPFSAQAEYVLRNLDLTSGGSAAVSGGYGQLTYTLTGESRVYKPYWARMDKIKPSGAHSFGAVELVLRYDDVTLEDAVGGDATAQNITAGVNWYLTPHLLLKLNYVTTQAEGFGTAHEDGDAITTRMAFNF